MANEPYEISLGIELNDSDFSNIKSQIKSLEKDSIKIKFDVDSQISNIKKQLQDLSNIKINISAGNGSGSSTSNSGVVKELNKEMANFVKLQKQISNMNFKISSLESIGGKTNQITELNRQLEELEITYENLMHTFMKKLTANADIMSMGDVVKFSNEIAAETQKAENKLREFEAKYADTRAQLAKEIEIKLKSGKFTAQVEKVDSDAKKLSKTYNELEQKLNMLRDAESVMNSTFKNGTVDEKIAAYDKYKFALESVENQLKQNKIAEQNINSAEALTQKTKGLSLEMDNWLKDNSAAAKKFGGTIRELKLRLESCNDVEYGNIKREFQNIKKEAQSLGLTTKTLGDKIKEQFAQYSTYLSVASVFMYVEQAMKSMFDQVVAIDSAMTKLKKVTNESDASYNRFLSNASSKAKELSTTVDGLVASTADFARLGYGFEDAQGLAEVANIYAVVGDEIDGVETATKSLISTLTAFKDEANGLSDSDFALSIVDKFNEVSNNFAISSGGIGEALQRSASSMAAANNSLDETIALITAANTVVQDPDTIGTAFKTISMRIRGATTELEEAGLETEGMASSTAKLREEIMALSGVDIMLNENEFKSTYKIMEELAAKWQDLTDIQQASITELIAGKRQGNIVSSLMNNFDIAQNALETSLNSAGSAMAEHEKWQKSLEARLLKLQAAWQGLAQSFMSSDFLKFALDGIIALVDGVNALIDTFGTLPTLIGLLGAFESLQGIGLFKTVVDEADSTKRKITNIFSDAAKQTNNAFKTISLKTDSSFKTSVDADIEALNRWTDELSKGPPVVDVFDKVFKNASDSAKEFAKSGRLATDGIDGFIKKQKEAQVSILAQNKSLSNSWAIIKEYFSGCKNAAMGTKDFANAVGKTNPKLAAQLTTAKSAKGAFAGYVTSLVGAKLATFALEAATMALNMALTMGISAAITWLITKFDEWYESADELAERIGEITSEYKEQHNTLMKLKGDYNTSNENSMISKYKELSKGVNALGENISLTADEYSEYRSIVDTIAGQIPSLVTGYNSQGDAILSCAGNVNELTDAYKNLIREQNKEVLDSGSDIFKDFKNDLKETTAYYEENLYDSNGNFVGALQHYNTEHFDELKELMNLNGDELETAIANLSYDEVSRISGLLDEYGIERDLLGSGEAGWETQREHVIRALGKDRAEIKSVLDKAAADLNAYAEDLGTVTEAYFSDAFLGDYSHMSDRMQGIINQITSSFDSEFYADFLEKDNPYDELTKYYDSILKAFDGLSNSDANELETAFDLKTQFNGGDISYGEYVKSLEDVGKLVDGLDLDDDVKSQIKIGLGLDEEGFVEEYNALVKRLSGTDKNNVRISDFEIDEKAARKFLDELSAEELSVATKIIPELSENGVWETVEDLKKAISREMAVQGLTFDLNFEVESASIEAFNTALTESVSGAGLSSDSINALKGRYAELETQGYDLSAMFEETSNGIHINRKAVRELEQAYSDQKLKDINADLKSLNDEYNLLTQDINNCNDASERASLYVQRDAIAQQIKDAATLASQYEGLTSAYNDWLSAEASGQERDMYEKVIEGFGNIDDEISRGWIDDGSIEFLELLTGRTDLATLSAKELKNVYKGLKKDIDGTSYSVRDFFTVDDDGNSTSTGVYNFLNAIEQLKKSKFKGFEGLDKLIERDEKTGKITKFDFSVVGGDEAIAEALGISEELVQIMQRAADDAGFVVTLDGAYTQLADLKTSAEEANSALKKLGKTDYDFNFGANNLEDLNTELAEANKVLDKFRNKDGKINMEMEGAKEALEIASYFTATIDKLTEPVYMQLETNQVEKDLQDPLEKMQEFERLSKTKHQLALEGDTKELEKVEEKMTNIAKGLEGLDKETKVKLGIDGLTTDEIKKKLEEGEIEIPATVDIQLDMSEDIKDMRLLMMNQLGLVSDEEVKLKIGYEIDDSAVDTLTDEEKKVVIKYIEENKDAWDKLSEEEKEAVVKIVADGTDVENWEAKEKEALVKYVVDGGEVEDWTPEEKQAFAKYLVDGGEVEGWSPEAKDAFVKYLVDGGDPDKFDPDDKESWVVYKKDSSEPDNYNPDDEDATVVYDKDSSIPDNYDPGNPFAVVTYTKDSTDVDGYDPPDIFRKVYYTIVETVQKIASGGASKANQRTGADPDGSGVNGTANVNGTIGRAFKQGSWGTKNSGTALVGELGTETLVRNGRYYTIGNNGAEFIKYQKGDIIFNHKQTEELFKNGRVTSGGGRAKAFVSGTAFSSGTGGGIEPEVKSYSVGSSSNKSSSKSSSSSSSDKEFEETLDWIETKINRIERAIDQLDTKASSVYRSWSERNKALTSEISKVGDEISLQQAAYNRYMQEANSIGLSESWAKLVRDGAIDIDTITDENLADKIKSYTEWYEKALDCKDAILELQEAESKLYAQRFENVSAQYDGILQGFEHTENMLNEYISQAEEQGYIVSKKYYEALINNEKSNIAQFKKEQADLIASRDEAVDSGAIVKGSEEWYNMCAEIDGVTQAIEESTTALLEYDNAMRDIDWSVFDLIQERISDVTDEAEFLIELMSNDRLFDDNGKLTSQGLATMGLHAQNYNTHMYQADEYGAEVAKLNKQIASDPYDQELINRRNEILELQRESILAAEDEKEAIRDMVEEGIELELDALQERIDKYNDALDSQKDLYDYQKKVKKQTEEIASLEKQMAAYSGDDSEEAKQKIQQIKVDLESAREDLAETEYEKLISDQQQLLDTLYDEYELILNQRLDNVDYLLEQVVESINAVAGADSAVMSALGAEGAISVAISDNATSIKTTLATEAKNVGTTLSTAMNQIWSVGEGNAKSVLTMYGEDFKTKSTTINTTLNGIKTSVNNVVNALNKEATKKVTANKTATSAKKDPTKTMTTTKKTTTTAKKSSGDGKPKIGDKVTFVSGQYYYDSQGKKPLGSKYKGKQVYITNINTRDWATHGYHISTGKKLGDGDLGWLKLNQISGYVSGKKNFLDDEVAWTQENGTEFIVRPSDGAILTPITRKGSVLNAQASSNLWDMTNSPAEFIRDNLNLGAADIPNNSSVQNSYVQNLDKVVFNLPNIKNYDEFLAAMQKDKNFERLVTAMTIDRIAGKSSLAKNKSIR